jgi:putative transposase
VCRVQRGIANVSSTSRASRRSADGRHRSAVGFARYIIDRPDFTHVWTRHNSPGTNGLVERFFETLKHDDLYRHDISDGDALAAYVNAFRHFCNDVSPHEALGQAQPVDAYLTDPTPSL